MKTRVNPETRIVNLLLIGLLIVIPSIRADDPAEPSPCPDRESLNAVIWMQTSGEYAAQTIGIYRSAAERLKEALADPDKTWSAAIEQPVCDSAMPPAIIIDLDETILDNSAFEAQVLLDQIRRVHLQRQEFLELEAAGLVPGALDFILGVIKSEVKVFAITNRRLPEKDHTLGNLGKLGIPADNPARFEVLFRNDSVGWTRDKTSRRREVAKTHRIVMIVGDQLGDFVSTEGADSTKRRDLATNHSSFWGTRWHILPNPVYGDWLPRNENPLKGYKQKP